MSTVQSGRPKLSREGRDVLARVRRATQQYLGIEEYANAGRVRHGRGRLVGLSVRSRAMVLRLKSPIVADLRNVVCDAVLKYTITQDHEDRVAMLRLIDRYEEIAEREEEFRKQSGGL